MKVKQIPFKYVPRPCHIDELNDCTVRALANATGLTYESSHELLAESGRKQYKGHYIHTLYDAIVSKGVWVKDCAAGKVSTITVARFISENPTGSYICLIRGHVFAVVDGVVHDSFRCRPGARVRRYWKV
jgi:hypothetical protein